MSDPAAQPTEPRNEMPFFDGEQGWVSQKYEAPTPRFPGKHNPLEGWTIAGKEKHFAPGDFGWVAEEDEEMEDSGTARMSDQERRSHKHHAGRRGWVAPGWDYSDKYSRYNPNPNLPVPSRSNGNIRYFSPEASIANGEKTVVVEIELPGVTPENVSLELVSQVAQPVPFTSASDEQAIVPRSASAPHSKSCYLLVRGFKHSKWDVTKVMDERQYGFFERSLFLGDRVNKDSPMMAKLESGILTVYVAKPKALQK